MKQVVFSAVQPTGELHLGNYLGALKQFKLLHDQTENYNCIFCVADLHAMTVPYTLSKMAENILMIVATYLAIGIDPKQAIILIQSQVPEHTMLGWLLTCNTPMGWLNRMTQFKSKNKQHNTAGLYTYPCLMAADILLYKTQIVPIGHDQIQHIELVNDLCQKLNHTFTTNYWQYVKPLISKLSRIMSLQDATQKMSKSDHSNYARINLLDTNEVIINKVMHAKTDAQLFPSSIAELDNRPEIRNLVSIYASLTDTKIESIITGFANCYLSEFKQSMANQLVSILSPIRTKILLLLDSQHYLYQVIQEGQKKASDIAQQSWKEIKQIVGLQ